MRFKFYHLFLLINISLLPCTSLCGKEVYFDTTWNLSFADKIIVVERIYAQKISKLDSITALDVLSSFLQQAKEKDDVVLEALAYNYLGLYYWNNGQASLGPEHYKKGIDLCHKHGEKIMEAIIIHNLGYQYFAKHTYSMGFEYMLRGDDMMKNIGYAGCPNIAKYLYELGYAYYSMRYYDKAVSYLKLAGQFPFANSVYCIWINNALALSYQTQEQYDSAFYFFNDALKCAYERKDTVWIGIVGGNIGGIYMRKKEYDKALPLLKLDYAASLRYKEMGSASNALQSFAVIAMEKGDLALAHRYMDTSRLIAEGVTNYPETNSWKRSYYSVLAQIYFKEQKWQQAFMAVDSEYAAASRIWRNNNVQLLSQVESKIEVEKHLAELRLMESEQSRLLIRRNAIIVVLLLSVIVVLQTLRRIQLKRKNAEDEVSNAKQLLASYTDRLQKNTQLIDSFKEEVGKLKAAANHEQTEDEDINNRLHTFTILKEEDWKEFKTLFSKVYSDFFVNLHKKYPDITQAETRFLALSKLNLSIDEMANALGVSPASVRKTRYRLLKKLDISEDELLKIISSE